MNRWAVIAAIVGAAFVTSCVPTSVMVRPATGLPTAAAPAPTFWEALDTFDLERAKQLAADQAQQDLAFAIATAYEGNVDEAVAAARRSWPAMPDSESKRRALAQLEELLTSQSRWKEILDVYAQDPTPVEPTQDIRPLALAYQNAPIERRNRSRAGSDRNGDNANDCHSRGRYRSPATWRPRDHESSSRRRRVVSAASPTPGVDGLEGRRRARLERDTSDDAANQLP